MANMDPISDMFIRIKNAQKAGHETTHIPYSKFKHEVVKTLERAGMVGKIERRGKKVRKTLEVALIYQDGIPKVRNIRFASTPGRRVYLSVKDIRKSSYGGVFIFSTPRGVMTDKEARQGRVGGELIAEVW